jgi:chromosome segregation ATPase
MVITQCEPVNGQQWTDGYEVYSDDGRYYPSQREDTQDLVEYIGPQPVSRPAETESTTAVAGGVSEDPGRIIYELEERLKTANATIDRLRAELQQTQQWRTAATDAHSQSETLRIEQAIRIERLQADNEQLRSANEYIATLERLLEDASDNLRELREDREATERHCDGAKSAFLAIIKTLWETRR